MFCPFIKRDCVGAECVFHKPNFQIPEEGECKINIALDDIDTIKLALGIVELNEINKITGEVTNE